MRLGAYAAVLFIAWLGLAGCVQEPPQCLRLSQAEAINLATESKKHLRLNNEMQRMFASDDIRRVELRNISDGSEIGAIVTFEGSAAPVGLINGDCLIEWSQSQ